MFILHTEQFVLDISLCFPPPFCCVSWCDRQVMSRTNGNGEADLYYKLQVFGKRILEPLEFPFGPGGNQKI